MSTIYKLHIECPLCEETCVRVVMDDSEDTRIICTACKKLDVVVDEGDAWSCLSAITEVVEHEELEDVIVDKLHMEE